jgi:hypothetical protein
LLASLAALAWAALWWWSVSPWGRFLDQRGWADGGALAALCRAVPQGEFIVPASLHAIAWVLMIAAMMLPTTLPLLLMFRRITQSRPDAGRLAVLVVLVAWARFGVAAHLADEILRAVAADSAVHRVVGRSVRRCWSAPGCSSSARLNTSPGAVPDTVRLRQLALAWPDAEPGCDADRFRPRPVLRRLLLGADARHVRRRHGQSRLDAALAAVMAAEEPAGFAFSTRSGRADRCVVIIVANA